MRRLIRFLITFIFVVLILVFGVSAFVTWSVSKDITGSERAGGIDPQCILVLGCGVWKDNQPSPMLKDRMDTAIELYNAGVAPKLLLSGDNSVKEYSEPDCMLAYALEKGVPKEDIFLDFAGFSTYDSVYRARAIFKANRLVIVSQKYHLYRALRISKSLGIPTRGVAANQRKYAGWYLREAREVLARDKDFVKSLMKPKPTFLGEEIPISGDGTATHVNTK